VYPFRDFKKTGVFLLIITLIGLFYLLGLQEHVSLSSLKGNFQAIKAFQAEYPVTTAATFISLFILLSALALPGPLVLCLAAGALFGVVTGTLYVTIAATIGASLSFLATRYLFRDRLRKKFEKRLKKANTLLEKEGFVHLLLIRLIPVVPFTLINIGASLTKMPLRIFILATFVGIIPPGFILCNAGANLAAVTNVRDIMSVKVLGSILLLGVVPLLVLVRRRFLKKESGPHDT